MSDEMKKMFGGFEKMAKQWQDAVVEGFGSMTKEAVASDEFAKASAEQMDWSMAGQQRIRDNSAQFLDSLELPKRSDLARLSKQLSNAETRLADCEQVLDRMLSTLRRMEGRLEEVLDAKVATTLTAMSGNLSVARAGLAAGGAVAEAAAPQAAAGKEASLNKQASLAVVRAKPVKGHDARRPAAKSAAPLKAAPEPKAGAIPAKAEKKPIDAEKKVPAAAPQKSGAKARAASAKNAGRASKKGR